MAGEITLSAFGKLVCQLAAEHGRLKVVREDGEDGVVVTIRARSLPEPLQYLVKGAR